MYLVQKRKTLPFQRFILPTNHLLFRDLFIPPIQSMSICYYMPKTVSEQDNANPAFWLVTWVAMWAGKMGLWISRIRPPRESSLFGHIMNPLLAKFVRSRSWLYLLGLIFFAFLWPWRIKMQKGTWPISSHRLSWSHAWSLTHMYSTSLLAEVSHDVRDLC